MLRPLIKLRHVGVLGALLAIAPRPLAAQRVPDALPRYQVGAVDYAVIGVSALASALPALLGDQLPYASCAPCDPSELWGIDRGAIGDIRSGPARMSDITMLATIGGGGALTFMARGNQSRTAQWEDVAVYSQAVLITSAVTEWSKVLFQRPRPPRYGANAANYPDPEYGRSFPSGHTSTTFAAAAAYASILQRRGEAGKHTAEIVALFGAAALTGVLRVSAHKHFPTDVIAGAALGTAIGWAVPRLHRVQ